MMAQSEASIQAGIKDLLKNLGAYVVDTSQPRATMITPGLSDLIVMGWGRIAFVEVKTPDGKMSKHQVAFRREVEDNGGTYMVWTSSKDAWEWLKDVGAVQEAG